MTAGIANVLQGKADASQQLDSARDSSSVTAKHKSAQDPRLKEAAAQFEAVLLRQMLSCLEKTTSMPAGGQSGGGSIYGSMVVNTVADAVARAGGLGLASLITRSVQGPESGRTNPPGNGQLDSVRDSAHQGASPPAQTTTREVEPQ